MLLYQSSQTSSFFKNYYVKDFQENTLSSKLDLPFYHDLEKAKEKISTDHQELIFSDGDDLKQMRMSVFYKNNNQVSQKIFKSNNSLDPIQNIFSGSHQSIYFGLTKYRLIFIDGEEIISSESRNTDNLIQYYPVKNKSAIYLPSEHTPSFSSELISYDIINKKIERSSTYRTLPYDSCQEIGLGSSFWSPQDFIIYYCDQNKIFHFIKI